MDRGLLFLAYQASIERQFEHNQRARFNNPAFPHPGTGPDALVGQADGRRRVSLPGTGGRPASISPSGFVKVTGGGYFSSPSIPALAYLADPRRREETMKKKARRYVARAAGAPSLDEAYRALGEFIYKQNPYRATDDGVAGRSRHE